MSTGRISIARAISSSGVRSDSGGVLVAASVGAVDIVGQSYVSVSELEGTIAPGDPDEDPEGLTLDLAATERLRAERGA
jgi:hypothetical protein